MESVIFKGMLESFTHHLPDGIFVRHWKSDTPKAIIVAAHGMGTHSGRFEAIAQSMAKSGYASFCYDHPGHGNSPGKRGHIESYDQLLDTYQQVLDYAKSLYPDLPVFLFGHSMGGNVVLNFILRRKPEAAGAVISSPWIKLAFNPPFFKMVLAKMVVNLFPALRQSSKLNVIYISHDPEVLRTYGNDPLIHSYITPRFFLETSKAGLYALEHAAELPIPVYLFHGTEDHITSFAASKEFASKSEMCTFREWPGCYHEVHNEWVKEELMKSQVEFLNEIIEARGENSSAA